MNSNNRPDSYSSSFSVPIWLWAVCILCIAVGAVGLVVGFRVAPREAWLWLIVNFLIFTGLASGMLAWAAAFRVAKARWTPAINRLGHAALAFAPISAAALVALLVGVGNYAPWVQHPIPEKEAWLNVGFFVAREAILLAVFWILSFLLVRWSLMSDDKTTRGEGITDKDQFRLSAVGVAVVMLYAGVSTIISWDFVMSLSPEWVSTMFGVYYFCTNAYAALAVIVLLAAALRKMMRTSEFLKPQQFKDLGNLMLAFALFDMGLFFAQYLTIWYGNLPHEVKFIILRYYRGPWPWVGWMSFIVAYGIPFMLLQSRALKQSPKLMSAVSVLILLGIGLERYVMVVPSLMPRQLMISPIAGLSALAFIGAFVLTVTAFLAKYPPVSHAQLALSKVDEAEEESL
ncbi:MAG: hypothetical protein M1133_06340 [Armatimonadetes bacterium]|nr:hypothetical protein [Armatimonadota bacterium]